MHIILHAYSLVVVLMCVSVMNIPALEVWERSKTQRSTLWQSSSKLQKYPATR